jgi:membrane carboxypeptidase/penicillin-binding protein PbpC
MSGAPGDSPGVRRRFGGAVAPLARRGRRALHIQSPPNDATYLIDPTLRGDYQTLPLRAVADGRVRWRVDGQTVASSSWPLVPGRHTISAVDDAGNRDEVRIYVK